MYRTETKRDNIFHIVLCAIVLLISFFVSVMLLIDVDKPSYYSALFLLPTCFFICSLLFRDIYNHIPSNLGITIILLLSFVRTVLSPMFMCIGNYKGTITLGIEKNTTYATLLVIYELFCVFFLIYLQIYKKTSPRLESIEQKHILRKGGLRTYTLLLILTILILVGCNYISPALLSSYRTIFDISDEFFTNYEDHQIVSKYGTTFLKKLSLVAGQYLVRALSVLVPAWVIIVLDKKKTIVRTILSFLSCFMPLLWIGGGIARSLIYVICLLFLYNSVHHQRQSNSKGIGLLAVGGVAVIIWWLWRSDFSNLGEQFSSRLSAYFSGVNVVSGVFNLPNDFEYKLRYFVYDFTSTIPFGGTIFNISHETVQPFFNAYNHSHGQIPPTIAMAYYYLGPVLAPVYSMVFALLAIKAGNKWKQSTHSNRIKDLRLLLTVFTFAMGIVMYNIEVTMTTVFSLIFPMYILERIAYKKSGE